MKYFSIFLIFNLYSNSFVNKNILHKPWENNQNIIEKYNIEYDLIKYKNNDNMIKTYELDILKHFFLGKLDSNNNLSEDIRIHWDFSFKEILIADKSKYEYGIDCDEKNDCKILSEEKKMKIKYFIKEIEITYKEAEIYMNLNNKFNSKKPIKTKFLWGIDMNELVFNILGLNNKSKLWKPLLKNNHLKKIYLDYTYNKLILKLKEKRNKDFKKLIKNNNKSNLKFTKNIKYINNIVFSKVSSKNNNFLIKHANMWIMEKNKKLKSFDINICIDNNINLLFVTNKYNFLIKKLKSALCRDSEDCKFDNDLKSKYDLFSFNIKLYGEDKNNLASSSRFFIDENSFLYSNYNKNDKGELEYNFNRIIDINNKYNKECDLILGNLFFKYHHPIIKKIYNENKNKIETYIGFKNGIIEINKIYQTKNLIFFILGIIGLLICLIIVSKCIIKNNNELLDAELTK